MNMHQKTFLTSLNVILFSACHFVCGTAIAENVAADVPPIVAPADLSTTLDRDTTVVLDVRSREAFEAEHIPGSRWIDAEGWRGKTFEPTGLSDKDFWQNALRSAGIDSGDQVVVVGEAMPEISRMWWLLRYLGVKQAQVLDGGFAAWKKGDHQVEQGAPAAVDVGDFEVDLQGDMVAVLDDLQPQALEESGVCILDNRSTAEFTGSRGVGARTGHIPGSVHLEWNKFIDKEGKFLPKDKLIEVLKEHGVDPTKPIVTLCQTAGRSSVAALALDIVGVKQVKNYYRGWGEYAGALTVPVEKGP